MPVSSWMCRYGLTQGGTKILSVKLNEHIGPFGASAVRQRSEITDELTAASSRMKTKRRHRQTMTTTTARRNRKVSLVSIDFLIVILFNSDFSTPVFFFLSHCLVSFISSFFFIFHVVSDEMLRPSWWRDLDYLSSTAAAQSSFELSTRFFSMLKQLAGNYEFLIARWLCCAAAARWNNFQISMDGLVWHWGSKRIHVNPKIHTIQQ